MILGVISDTHDRVAQLELALNFFYAQSVDQVIHCGDWKSLSTVKACAELAATLGLPINGVLGNNDTAVEDFLHYAEQAPGKLQLMAGVLQMTLDSKHVAAYHGHHRPSRQRLIDDPVIDILLLGHSHKPLLHNAENKLVVNPGSTAFAIPRSKAWRPSVALVNTKTMAAQLHYLS